MFFNHWVGYFLIAIFCKGWCRGGRWGVGVIYDILLYIVCCNYWKTGSLLLNVVHFSWNFLEIMFHMFWIFFSGSTTERDASKYLYCLYILQTMFLNFIDQILHFQNLMMTTLVFHFTESKTYMVALLYSTIFLSEFTRVQNKYSCSLSFLRNSCYKNFWNFNIAYFLRTLTEHCVFIEHFKCLKIIIIRY